MLIKPNRTVLKGRVRAIRPESDGWGARVEFEVLQNESPSEDEDFLRPTPGSVIDAFSAEPDKLRVGELVRVDASLLAGPFGGRTVLEAVAPIEEPTSSNA